MMVADIAPYLKKQGRTSNGIKRRVEALGGEVEDLHGGMDQVESTLEEMNSKLDRDLEALASQKIRPAD